MFDPIHLSTPAFKEMIRRYEPGKKILEQGQTGSSMYIILSGIVHILKDSQDDVHLVAMLGSGEILGEEAFLQGKAFKRNFTVQAKTAITAIEIDQNALPLILKVFPDFHSRLLRMVLERLDNANKLFGILQLVDLHKRMISYLDHFLEFNRQHLPKGSEILIKAKEITIAMSLPRDFVDHCMQELVTQRVFIETDFGFKFINKQPIQSYFQRLKVKIAA